MVCLICNTEWKNFKSLTNHLRNTHNITSKEYYDKFLKKLDEDYCKNPQCKSGIKTNFLGIWTGYNSFCSIECWKQYRSINGVPKYKRVETFNLCDYGCGNTAKFQLKSGKFCCSNRIERCPIIRKDISKRFKGKNRVPKGEEFDNYNNILCDYGCGKVSKFRFNNGKFCCSINPSGCSNYKKIRSKIAKENWLNPEFQKKYEIMTNFKPNKLEKFLTEFLNQNFPNQYIYVGNNKIRIGRRNPDFINKEEKKIIELFGDYWHSKEITGEDPKQNEKERINYFKKYGYKTLIIWENELKNLDNLKTKIINF